MRLRPYQERLVAGSLELWRSGNRRIAMVMATGGGKTPTAMTIAELSLAAESPVLWLAHRTELIDQAIDKARQVAPGRRIGRMQGPIKEYRAELVVGSVQTCSTPTSLALLATRRWGLVVVDETHHVAADTYQRVLRELGAYTPVGPLVLGVTATLDRADGLALGETFEAVVEPRVGLVDLIRSDPPYLVPPRGIRVHIAELDLDRVRRVAGDFRAGQLGAAMSAAMAPKRIVEAWEEHAKGRPTVAFLPTIALSVEVAQAFNDAGHRFVHLDAESLPESRRNALDDFRAGRLDGICNVNLFAEGTDLPCISCVILGAPTSSANRYQQQVGRGLRMHPGKRDCVILDVTGVTKRHKLATLVNLGGADRPEDIPDDLLMYEDDIVAGEMDDAGQESGDGPADVEYADGDLEHELIDLFGQSHAAWLRTNGGRWFLATSQGFIYLDPRGDDRYDLCWHADRFGSGESRGVIQAGMEIGYAMAAGDQYVAERPIWQAARTADWRGLPAGRGRTKGEVHDRKAVERASHLLDKPTR